jgi:peptidoglycan/xylan/chitin deacetylase (PgdA/CDA1 family)
MTNIPILMYHSISNNKGKMSVSKESFLNQMNTMKKLGFESITLKDIKNTQNKKKFVITFDDGYKDIFTNAYPILQKLNFKATCFFVFNKIGKFNEWDKDHNKFEKKDIMSEDELMEWYKNGFEVGSHSLDHKNLVQLDEEEKINQIIKSKDLFKKRYDIETKSFSYPFGLYNERVTRIVKNTYKYAVTTRRSRYKDNLCEDILIPRIPVNKNTSIFKFILKILTPYEDIKFKK